MKQNNLLTKALLLLAMIVGSVNASWATTDTYMLYYGVNKAVDGNNLNSSDFKFFGATSTTGASAVEIGGNSYTHYLKLPKYTSSIATDSSRVVAYDAKTTNTKITAYVKNGNSSARDFYIGTIIEGETSENTTANTRKKTTNVSGNGVAKIEFSITNSITEGKNTLIGLYGGGKADWEIYQVVVEESGDPLLQGGEDGYALIFPGRVCVAGKNADNTTPTIVDGMEILGSSSLNYLAGPLKLKQTTSYIKFTLSEKTLVSVTPNNTRKYIFSSSNTPAGTETKYGGTASTTVKTALAAGTWYLESENGSEFQLKDISFSIPIVTYNANGGSGSMGTTKITVAANGFTAPTGQEFQEWNTESDGTGESYEAGDEVESNTTLYAIWYTPAVKHHVTYDLNGGTGTTPTQDDVEEGKTFTVASGTDGITAPAGKIFSTWNDGSADYAPGSTYTMSTSDVTLTAQWANLYTITYNKGTNGTGSISSGQKTEGVAFTLSSEMFTREGYVQTGWATSDGGAKAYNLGGSYIDDADITLYPVWEGVASNGFAFTYGASAPAGWTFSTDDGWADNKKIAAYVKDFTDNSVVAPGENGMKNGWVAFAKNTSACATYDLGSVVTVAGITATLYGGSSSSFNQKITYVGADGSTVLKEYTNALNAGNWAANSISQAEAVPNVRYIKVYGASKWVVMSNFTVSYGTAASSDPVSITPAKEYTTYIPSYGLDFTGNTKLSAYIATDASASTVTMTKVDKVPAGTPIILKATETGSPIDVNKASSTDDVSSNKLMASDGSTSIGGDGKWDYILSNGVFYHASAGVLPAGKCYLHLTAEPEAKELTMDFGDGNVTGIANINALKTEVNGEYYNLAGQHVAQPTKGLYIVNGKKVVIK